MASNGTGDIIFGFLFIVISLMALTFGSSEPALQGEQGDLMIMGLFVIGILILANGFSKRRQSKMVA